MIRKVLIETALILCMTVVPYVAFVYAVRSGHVAFFPVPPAHHPAAHPLHRRGAH